MATYKVFDPHDIVSTPKTKSYPLWTDNPLDPDTVGEAALITFFTASADTGSFDFNYFWNVYAESEANNLNAAPQFSLAIGYTSSVNLFTTDDTLRDTRPAYAVYKQFANILTNEGSDALLTTSDGHTIGLAYFISIARDRMKDGVDPNTWQLVLSGSRLDPSFPGQISLVAKAATSVNQTVFDIVVGSVASGSEGNDYSGSAYPFGIFHADKGIFVLDAMRLHVSPSFAWPNSFTGKQQSPLACFSQSRADETDSLTMGYRPFSGSYSFFSAIRSGSFFRAKSTEIVQATHYFVRVKNFEYNSSENPTWRTGSNNEIREEFYNEPKTFITTIGLYDGDDVNVPGKLVAVAKLSKPLLKTPDSEALVRIRLDFVWFVTMIPLAHSIIQTILS